MRVINLSWVIKYTIPAAMLDLDSARRVSHARAKPNYCRPGFLRQSEIFAPRRERCRRLYQLPADNSLVSTDFASVFWQKPRNSCIKWRKTIWRSGINYSTILALSVICLVIVWWFQWFIHFKLAEKRLFSFEFVWKSLLAKAHELVVVNSNSNVFYLIINGCQAKENLENI